MKIHYQKLSLENIAMKANSCLEKLQDSSKSSVQLATVNKATQGYDRVRTGLRQKKTDSTDKRFLTMVMVVGLLY